MKTFIISLMLLPLTVFCQKEGYPDVAVPVDNDTKLITYTKIVEFTANKDSVYNKGLAWFNSYFKNPTGVIREKSPETGTIMGKHQIKILNPPDKKGVPTMKGIIQYTVKVSTKDNKTRIILTEFNLKSQSYTPIEPWADKTSSTYNNINQYYLDQIDKESNALIEHFQKFMTEAIKVKTDNW